MNTILITGASGSMGSAAVEALAEDGWCVIMACRSLEKGGRVREGILARHPDARLELLRLDLTSLDSVRELAATLEGRRIDVLFHNAGTICRTFSRTQDGYERTFQVNCVAPALLTELLTSHLGRIVTMTSLSCRFTRISADYQGDSEKSFSQIGAYARAKLGLSLHTLEFGRRTGIPVSLADPGVVNTGMISLDRWFDPITDILFRPFCHSPEQGVLPALRAIRSGNPHSDGLSSTSQPTGRVRVESAPDANRTDRPPLYFVGHRALPIPTRFAHSQLPSCVTQ